jgi:DNA-binding transcriptional regulator YiaG
MRKLTFSDSELKKMAALVKEAEKEADTGIRSKLFKNHVFKVLITKEEIVALRKVQLGLGRKDFANKLGISVRTVQAWEQGARVPDTLAAKTLVYISRHPKHIQELEAI